MKTILSDFSVSSWHIAPRTKAFFAVTALSALAFGAACDARFASDSPEASAPLPTLRPITHGAPSPKGYQDATLLLAYQGTGICTATLITDTVAITAAHCVYVKDCEYNFETGETENCQLETTPSHFALYAGQKVSNAMEGRVVQAIYAHDGYDDYALNNDITLLKIGKPFTAIQPIPVLPQRDELALNNADMGLVLTYAGFGLDENGRDPNQRLTVASQVDYICSGSRYCTFQSPDSSPEDLYAPPKTFCSFMDKGGTCNGDSGGPAYLVKDGVTYVGGVTSYGDKNCAIYGCSTDISAFGEWIADQLSAMELAQGAFCTSDSQCASGFCSEGICCDQRCDHTLCQSCRASRGATQDGICTPIVTCEEETDCTEQGQCNPKTGQCTVANKPASTVCDDSNACTLDDHCFNGACNGSGSVWCAPPSECQALRADSLTCDPANGACLYDNLPDGESCTGGTCLDGKCRSDTTSSDGCGVVIHSTPTGSGNSPIPLFALLGSALVAFKKRRKNNKFQLPNP